MPRDGCDRSESHSRGLHVSCPDLDLSSADHACHSADLDVCSAELACQFPGSLMSVPRITHVSSPELEI